MRSAATSFVCCLAALCSLVVGGRAQDTPATSVTNDPRVGLKAGFRDAGVAARGMQLISTLPKPEGFFDPKEPAGPAARRSQRQARIPRRRRPRSRPRRVSRPELLPPPPRRRRPRGGAA
jgi:hypothetical protein